MRIDGTIQFHLFAPTLKDRIEWLTEFFYSLLLDGEITLLDGSPMFITDIREGFSFDEVRGQISIDVNFGVLRKPDYAHILVGTNFSSSAEGKFLTDEIFDNDSPPEFADNDFRKLEKKIMDDEKKNCRD